MEPQPRAALLFAAPARPALALYKLEAPLRASPESAGAVRRREAQRVRALRAAEEAGRAGTHRRERIRNVPESGFVSWSSLRDATMDLKQNATLKHETQVISDTQMMDAADGAEAVLQMINNKGMTQLFDTLFHVKVANKHIPDTNKSKEEGYLTGEGKVEMEVNHNLTEKIINDGHLNVEDNIITKDNARHKTSPSTLQKSCTVEIIRENKGNELDLSISKIKETHNFGTNASNSLVQINENMIIEGNGSLKFLTDQEPTQNATREEHRASSPILTTVLKSNVRLKRKRQSNCFSLEVFEKFEQTANKLLKTTQAYYDLGRNDDLAECSDLKHLYSELGKNNECYQNGSNVGTENKKIDDHESSNIYNAEILEIKSSINKDLKNYPNDVNMQQVDTPNVFIENSMNTSIEDEILFSDEETFSDLTKNAPPLTCKFNSLQGESVVLDKSLYVCFTTASNRSIQVNCDSFFKAKEVFSDIDNGDNVNDKELQPLMEGKGTIKSLISKITEEEDVTIIRKLFEQQDEQCKTEEVLKSEECKETSPVLNSSKKLNIKTNKLVNSQSLNECGIPSFNSNENLVHKHNDFHTEDLFHGIEDIHETGTEFTGFKTAANKIIKISDGALAKTRQLFSDIDNEVTLLVKDEISKETNKLQECFAEEDNIEIVPRFQENSYLDPLPVSQKYEGFSTASNNNIMVLKEASTKDIFKNIDELPVNESSSVQHYQEKIGNFKGFSAVRNGNIEISEKQLAREADATDVYNFQTLTKDKDNVASKDIAGNKKIIQQGANQFPLSQKFGGFSSKEALIETRNFFMDIENLEADMMHKQRSEVMKFEGFATASNKNIKISEKGLAKTKLIFKDIEELSSQEYYTTNNKNVIDPKALANTKNVFQDDAEYFPMSQKFGGFSTASNKNLTVSKESLAKTRKKFNYIDQYEEPSPFSKPNVLGMVVQTKIEGFTTASNKNIKISEKALAKIKNVFQDIDITEALIEIPEIQEPATGSNRNLSASKEALVKTGSQFHDNVDLLPMSQKFGGFSTASNKNITVSKDSLAKTRTFFNDIDQYQAPNSFTKQNESCMMEPTKFKGFTTADCKHIKISEKELAKTKNIFEDINITQDLKEIPNYQESTLTGHEYNKSVEEALQKTKTFFQDDADLFPMSQRYGGFSTASNKNIRVSKETLAKTKLFFQEMENDGVKEIKKVQGMVTENKENIKGCKKALGKTRTNFQNEEQVEEFKAFGCIKKNLHQKKVLSSGDNPTAEMESFKLKNVEMNLQENLHIDTQIQKCFADTMSTEDFDKSHNVAPRKNQTPGSPILSCPNAKRRKPNTFKVPYSQKAQNKIEIVPGIIEVMREQNKILYKFDNDYKKGIKLPLKDYLKDVKHHTAKLDLNFDDLLKYEFKGERNDLTDTKLGIEDVKMIFLNSVDVKIVPDGWLDNHIKLIMWKLLSYEIFYAGVSNVATAKNVMEQLKYRYDRELQAVERPVLRKILEKDETPARAMVLCVSRILTEAPRNQSAANVTDVELEVTDGWYCVRATIDKMLRRAVTDGKIVVGCKLATCGAELLNCEQGKAPWEDTSSVRLRLHGNSTWRAARLARLGLRGGGAALATVPLARVAPDGGRAARVRVLVARRYPPLYVERLEDGSTVTRSERLETIHSAGLEAERHAVLERIYEEVEREVCGGGAPESQEEEGEGGSAGRRCCDEAAAELTASQVDLVNEYSARKRDRMMERIRKRVEDKIEESKLGARRVVPLLKIRIVGWHGDRNNKPTKTDHKNYMNKSNVKATDVNVTGVKSTDVKKTAVKDVGNSAAYTIDEGLEMTSGWLSIWKPSEHLLDVIREGFWLDCMNVVATSVRMSELHLSAGRQAMFSKARQVDTAVAARADSVRRECTKIRDVHKNTVFNEIDTAGLIFAIEPSVDEFEKQTIQSGNFQNVYLADAEKNFVCVNFWGGLKKFGYDKILTAGKFVCCSNLQKRMGNSRKSIPQFRVTEFTVFTQTPKDSGCSEALNALKADFETVELSAFCRECAELKNAAVISRNAENISPYRFNISDYNVSRNKMFIDSVYRRNEDDFNLAGLDFDSTFKQESQTDEQLKRKARIKSKMDKLKRYGEPPPLSPMHIINKSINVNDSFKSPVLVRTDSCSESTCANSRDNNIVARLKDNSTNNEITEEDVPIFGSNDSASVTGVKIISADNTPESKKKILGKKKRSFVNPVKLEFMSEGVASKKRCVEGGDDFEGDFECSPPLSLDTVMF